MDSLAPALRYLRDCYQADSREAALWDLRGKRVVSPFRWDGRDELLDGSLDRLPADHDWASEAATQAQVRRRERRLILAAFVLVGRTPAPKSRRLHAPLFYFDAEIELSEVAGQPIGFVRPDLDEPHWNTPVLAALVDGDEGSAVLHELVEALPKPPFAARDLFTMSERLGELLPDVDWSGLDTWPRLASEAELAQAGRRQGLTCLPFLMSGLVVTPPASRGVIHELSELAELPTFSPPLEAALSGRAPESAARRAVKVGSVPAALSGAQDDVLSHAANEPLSLVDGPPGTGKSFTTAAVAVEHVARGESVLIVTRSSFALAAIETHVIELLGEPGFAVVATSQDRLRGYRARLDGLRGGRVPFEASSAPDRKRMASQLRRTGARLALLSRRFQDQAQQEQELGELESLRQGEHWLDGLRRRWHALATRRHARQDELAAEWHRLRDRHVGLVRRYLQASLRSRLLEFIERNRANLNRLSRAPFARTTERRERYLEDAGVAPILEALPLWLCDVAALPRVLPLEDSLFDVVLIDEATHCDPASCLPALQRAKRAVVTGDPRQLRHVSFLSRARQRLLAERHDLSADQMIRLDYRGKSLLDLVDEALDQSSAASFLDEHFRSRPRLIAFSNREFYTNRLRIMTARPRPGNEQELQFARVDGRRLPGGHNAGEVTALADELARQVEAARLAGEVPSIGVLSPFRAQVDALSEEIVSRFSLAELRKHSVFIATAHGFQGHERDVMLLSLAIDDASAAGARRWLERPDVLNVSLTRARSKQVVFHSFDAAALPVSSLLRRYFDLAREGKERLHLVRLKDEDPYLRSIRTRAEAEGFQVHVAFDIAGEHLDLVLVRDERAMGVDLIGEPGRFSAAWPLRRLGLIRRAGLVVYPACRSRWNRDTEAEWSRLTAAFERRAD